MKIIYTSLQEIDGGITRSARQLRIDFGGSGKAGARLPENGERGGAGRDDSLLPPRGRASGLYRPPEKPDNAPCDAGEENGETRKHLRAGTPPALPDANSAAHLLVRKFVEAQMCSRQAVERQGRIDIFV